MTEFEPNYLRKTYRLKLPAEVLIENKKYKVVDWSYEGFGIEKSPQDNFEKEKEYNVKFVLPFASFQVSFNAKAVLKWQKENRAGFQFLHLSDEIKRMIRSYVEAYIEGRLEDVGGILSPARTQVIPPQIEKPLSEEERRKLNLKFFIAGFFYTAGFVGLIALFLAVFVYFRHIKSVEAFVSGNIYHILSPTYGFVVKFFKKEGDLVRAKEPLILIESRELKEKYENYKKLLSELNLKFEKVSINKKRLRRKLAEVRKLLEIYKERLRKLEKAYSKGLISVTDLISLKEKIQALREKEEKIKYKLFLIAKLKTRLKDLNSSAKEIKKNDFLRIVNNYYVEILSPSSGRVLSRFRHEGEYVSAGEPLMILERKGKELYVIARFKEDEGKYITIGDKAVVYFPSIDKFSEGIVIGIGKATLSEESLVSETEEYALRDVPVKVKLLNPPPDLHYGMKAEVIVRTKNYGPYILTFIKTLIR